MLERWSGETWAQLADGGVLRLGQPTRYVLGVHASASMLPRRGAERPWSRWLRPAMAGGLLVSEAGERGAHGERRPSVLGAEGIEVEGGGRRGECGGGQQRERRGKTTRHG